VGTGGSRHTSGSGRDAGFVHEAFLYDGADAFVDRIGAFARAGVEAGEPVLVMVGARKLDQLRDALDGSAAGVEFVDMEQVGANPGRIIPAWAEFLGRAGDAPRVRGVGEPIWSGRPPAELVESQHHEALINLAFADASQMWLVCPYDLDALDADVIDAARHTHPLVSHTDVGGTEASTTYRPLVDLTADALEQPLAPPTPPATETLSFGRGDLSAVRHAVSRHAAGAGLGTVQVEDLVLAVNEVATNSVKYGGGGGTVAIWDDAGSVICEVHDAGRIEEPLVGRRRPPLGHVGGAGLYLAHQFCDLVQLRSSTGGTTVRLHMRHK
jgi:anti-sigma regulatory factor (Ser/Thr protein kinase)